ncbi:MAG: DUF4194 domain-containing protein [Immundisolibacterales bacterium]|nr:DUF4194 domain-containing protein [Immundisolibacterales bacterium]
MTGVTMAEAPPGGAPARTDPLPALVIPLLKGVLYREGDPALWSTLVELQARVRDYVAVLGLELMLDEAEGYAFLRSRPEAEEEPETGVRPPRLVARRPLSFHVSLLLALLRKKLAEFDAGGGDTRLVLSRDEVVEMVRVFLPESTNEARVVERIDAHLNRIVDLGFLRRMKPESDASSRAGQTSFEVRRILKAFVDADWLAELDARLAAYRAELAGSGEGGEGEGEGESEGAGPG